MANTQKQKKKPRLTIEQQEAFQRQLYKRRLTKKAFADLTEIVIAPGAEPFHKPVLEYYNFHAVSKGYRAESKAMAVILRFLKRCKEAKEK